MIAHGTGLALLVLGGKRDELTLADYLAKQGLGGPISALCVDYLRGAKQEGPLIPMADFVRRAADLLGADPPRLGARVEATLASYDLTVGAIDAYLRAIKNSSQGAFSSALRGGRDTARHTPEPVLGRLV